MKRIGLILLILLGKAIATDNIVINFTNNSNAAVTFFLGSSGGNLADCNNNVFYTNQTGTWGYVPNEFTVPANGGIYYYSTSVNTVFGTGENGISFCDNQNSCEQAQHAFYIFDPIIGSLDISGGYLKYSDTVDGQGTCTVGSPTMENNTSEVDLVKVNGYNYNATIN